MNGIGINETAQLTGVTHRTLHFYEQKGLLKPRRNGRDRLYSVENVKRLHEIIRFRRYGFTVSQIKRGITHRDMVARYHELQLRIRELESAAHDLSIALKDGIDG